MTHLRRGDKDLHDENGEHRSTPPTANGHALELYERRILAHLADHADTDDEEAEIEEAEERSFWMDGDDDHRAFGRAVYGY